MEFEDLVKVWRDEGTGEVRRTRVESLSDLRGRAKQQEENARHRFRRAVIVWLAIVPLFGFGICLAFLRGDLLDGTALAILAIGCVAPAVYYLKKRIRAEVDPALPVRVALATEVERLRELRLSIRAMSNWVAGALVIVGLMIPSDSDEPLHAIAWAAFFCLVGISGWKGWRRFANRLQPTIEELESWIADLERI